MPQDCGQSPPEQPTGAEADYLEIQRRAVQEVLNLSSEAVAPAEAEIEQQHDRAVRAAQKSLEETAAKIAARLQAELAAAEPAHAERIRQIEAEHKSALETLARKGGKTHRRVGAEYEEVERDAHRQREDKLLVSETVAEATLKGLHKELRAHERQITAGRRRVEALRSRAQQLMQARQCDLPAACAAADDGSPVADSAAAFEQQAQLAAKQVEGLQQAAAVRVFIGARPSALLALLNALAVGGMWVLSVLDVPYVQQFYISGPAALAVTLVVTVLVRGALRRRVRRRIQAQMQEAYGPLPEMLAAADRALDQRLARAKELFQRDEARASRLRAREIEAAGAEFDETVTEARQRRADALERLEAVRAEQQAEIDRLHATAAQEADDEKERRCALCQQQHDRELAVARQECERRTAAYQRQRAAARAELEARWATGLAHIRCLLEETEGFELAPRPDWDDVTRPSWAPPADFAALIPFGDWNLDLTGLAASVREHARFLAGRSLTVSIPIFLDLQNRCSLLLQTQRAERAEAIDALRAVMLRLLTSLPPGRVQFTILDPVGLGENFAGFMHLVDYEEALVGGRIWTESEHIEARLTELTAHMENVIQKYLRNEFETIDAYNRQAGELAEPYRFLVIADFPANFNEGAARRLSSIVSSGARCGIFTLIAHDQRLPTPSELHLEDLESTSLHLVFEDGRFVYKDESLRRFPLTLDAPPPEETVTRIMHVVGRRAKDSLRVEVPFESIAPPADKCWSGISSADLSVPLGHTGAVRRQHLRLGRGIAQHALIAGKTGSGKSTLLHVIVTNLALWYSPDEVEFYLVDFKKGVEFKTYVTHQLPHARAIAIESDREFGVSVLQRIDAEMARRGDLFRAAGVQDLAAYRQVSGALLPRTLLIVDEFQVFFTEDDKLSQDAAILLDRLVRQGRAFGIHVLLGSQTLGGTAGLARSTIGQMAVRIALQCSEADSQLILDDTNVAARLLSRPGEAIYNDAGGLVEGNSPFQTAWLPDDRRSVYLERVSELAQQRKVRREPPIVFEGNAPADIHQNRLLARLLESAGWPAVSAAPRAWLGEAVAIKDPTAVTLRRQSGAHLLCVGQREDAALAMMAAAMLCLGVQHAPGAARFVVLDGRPADAQRAGPLHDVAALLPHDTRFVEWRDVTDAIAELARETQRRLQSDQADAPAVYLLIYGLQRYRMLRRQEEDFSFAASDDDKPTAPDKQFAELLREGPPLGVHVVAWSDTLATLERTLDRQSIGEFDNRVLFQMSAADSSNLVDTPEANKLGFYRALFYSEEHGLLEKFRPYAAFEADWLAHVQRCFSRKTTSPNAGTRGT